MRLIHVFVLAAAQSCDSGDTAVCLLQLRTASNGTETDLRAAGGTETDETETDAYYLSPSGNDATGERGKRNKPFRTLAGLAGKHDLAGAHVRFRGGEYRWKRADGVVRGVAGLRLEPDPSDKEPVVLSGADTLKWKQEGPLWCAAAPEAEVSLQLWQDRRSLVEAQAPDLHGFLEDDLPVPESRATRATPGSGHVWDLDPDGAGMLQAGEQAEPGERYAVPPHCYFSCSSLCAELPGTGGKGCPNLRKDDACAKQHGKLQDPRFMENDYLGSSVHLTLCSGHQVQGPFSVVAQDKAAGTITFDYASYSCDAGKPSKRTDMFKGMISCWKDGWFVPSRPRFFVRGWAELDAPREWAVKDGRLCVHTAKPNGLLVRTRGTALSFEHCPGLTVRGLRFFGTELSATGGDFRDLTFEWPLRLNLGKSNLSRSTIRYLGKVGAKGVDSSGSGVAFDGFQGKGEPFAGCSLTDTLIEKSWAAVDFWDCKPAIALRNTIRFVYNGNLLQIFNRKLDDLGENRSVVAFNRLHDSGFNKHCDCSAIQTRWGAMKNMQVHNNWVYRTPVLKALRFDTSNNGGRLTQNVFWNTKKGLMVKGGMNQGNEVLHNTGFENTDCDLSVVPKEFGSGSTTPGKKYNHKSKVFNNAADDYRDSGKADCHTSDACELPCESGANAKHWGHWRRTKDQCYENPPVVEMLASVANFDFRPVHAALLGKADARFALLPDLGAYAAKGEYWLPGAQRAAASAPVPPHGSPFGQQEQLLAWLLPRDAEISTLYVGTSFCEIALAEHGNGPAYQGSFGGRSASKLVNFKLGDVVYWRVDSTAGKGEVWCFGVTDEALRLPWNEVSQRHACSTTELSGACCKKAMKKKGAKRAKRLRQCEALD